MNTVETDISRPAGASWLQLRLAATRAFSLPITVLPVVVAAAGVLPVSRWRWGVLLGSAIAAALLHLAGNLLNDYFDFRSGVDRKLTDDEGRPGRLLVRGQLTPPDILAEALACLAAGLATSAALVWACGPGLVWFGVAAVAALYAYTGPPLKLKYRALGEVVIFLTFGPALMMGAAFAQTGRIEWRAALLAVPVGLATTAIVAGNNVRDRDEDAAAHILTIARFAGGVAARVLYVLLVAFSCLLPAAMAAAGLAPWPLLLAPLTGLLLLRPLRCVWRGQRLPDIDARTAKFATALNALLAAALMWQGPL